MVFDEFSGVYGNPVWRREYSNVIFAVFVDVKGVS